MTAETQRLPLSRDRVLRAAVQLADRDGLEALTMRNLAHELGVEAMSIYYHVANKEAVLDGLVDMVIGEVNEEVGEIPHPETDAEWKGVMRDTILTARRVMVRHKWAPSVLESRTTLSPELLRYFHNLLALFRGGGFTYDLAHHALHALGSRALGFAQELFEPEEGTDDEDLSNELLAEMANELPYLVEMLTEISHPDDESTLGWCDDQVEFEFGLDLLLDGLERARRA